MGALEVPREVKLNFALDVRDELRERLALDSLPAADLWPWVIEQWRAQELRGERLTLTMPTPPADLFGAPYAPPLADPDAYNASLMAQLSEWRRLVVPGADQEDAERVWPPRRPYYLSSGRYWVDAFAGRYLEDHLELWPPKSRWSSWTLATNRHLQPLALVALAVTAVELATATDPECALGFLLCDEPLRWRGTRMRMGLSVPGGLFIWSPRSDMTAEELQAQYADARQSAGLTRRSRGLSSHPDELIALVAEMRPDGKPKSSWGQVWIRWQRTHKKDHPYQDPESLRKAHGAAVKRRQRRGLIEGSDK